MFKCLAALIIVGFHMQTDVTINVPPIPKGKFAGDSPFLLGAVYDK